MRLPDLAFEDADGKPRKLSDWRGKTVLLNLWATWCVPCRKEMPALDSLQAKLGGKDFEVVAVNIDTRDPEKPKNFLKEANLTRLGYFTDQKAKVFQDLKSVGKALGMPTSILIDGQGCEIANIAGPGRMGQRRRHQADQGRGAAGRRRAYRISSLGGYVRDCRRRRAPRLAVEGWSPPSRVWTANFSASALDFMMEVAICSCVFRRLHGEQARDHSHHIHTQHSPNARAPYPAAG